MAPTLLELLRKDNVECQRLADAFSVLYVLGQRQANDTEPRHWDKGKILLINVGNFRTITTTVN